MRGRADEEEPSRAAGSRLNDSRHRLRSCASRSRVRFDVCGGATLIFISALPLKTRVQELLVGCALRLEMFDCALHSRTHLPLY